MKKVVSLLLVLAMVLGLASFASAESDIVTLNWYTKGDKPKDYDMVMEQVNAYLAEKIGVNVNMNFIAWGDEWDSFISTAVATNTGDVDIIFTAVWDKMSSHIANGYLVPLNGDDDYGNLLEEYGQDALAAMDPSYITGNEVNGVLYGMSCNKELAANYGYLFNAELCEKYGFDVSTVKEIRDIEPMLQKIKEEMDAGNLPDLIAPFGTNKDGLSMFAPFVELAGDGTIIAQYSDNRSPEVVNEYATDEWKELFELAQDWYQKGYIATDAIQHEDYGAEYQTGYYFACVQSMKPGKGAEFSVNGVASLEAVVTPTVIRTKDVGGSFLSIAEGSQHPAEAMKFINLLESDETLINLLVFGIEGTHYNKAEGSDNIITVTEEGTAGWPMKGNAWMFGNQFLNYITTEEAADKWEQFKAFNAEGTPMLSLGFNYDPTEMTAALSALDTVKKQYNTLFIGAMDVEKDLPAFIAALDAAGISDVIADCQAQYDAWVAAK